MYPENISGYIQYETVLWQSIIHCCEAWSLATAVKSKISAAEMEGVRAKTTVI